MSPTANCWLRRFLASAAVLLLGVLPVRAYIIESSAWTEGTVPAPHRVTLQLELGTTGPANRTLSDGDTTWDQVAVDAMNDWNQYLRTMQFNPVPGSAAPVSSTSNGVNTVSWSTTVFGEAWGQGIVGLTFRYWQVTGSTIQPTQEADVLFNSNSSWDSYRGNLRTALDLRRVALHEFGHVLGLDHPNDYGQVVTAVMNSTISNLDDLAADDLAGAQYLYDVAPLITTQPASQTALQGGTATFAVATNNNPAATFQWKFNGAAIAGATNSTLTLSNVSASNQGNYQVVVTDRAATINSSVATLDLAAGPSITSNPASQTLATGAPLTLSVSTAGSSGLTYQWYLNGTSIAGATGSTYSLANAGATDAGSYTVEISNGVATSTSSAATVTVNTTARLINLSTQANVGATALTAGFVIGGSDSKNLLIRGIGPTLGTFGVPDVLSNPLLTLFNTAPVPNVTDAAWGGSAALSTAFASVGAFALPANSADSALLASYGQGSATANITGIGGAQGTALLEIYDMDATTAPARLVNLAVLTNSSATSNLIAGFVITGPSSLTLLVRGIGPTLAGSPFGLSNVLAQPILEIHHTDSNGVDSILQSNTGWGGTAALIGVFNAVGAFALPANSADSALLVTLASGSYSAVVKGVNNTSGTALVEIYEVR
jgi:hypothetical protein